MQFAYGEELNPGLESVGPVTVELLLADESYLPTGSVLATGSFDEYIDPGEGGWFWQGFAWNTLITLDPTKWYCIRLTRFTPVSQGIRYLLIGSSSVATPNNKFFSGGAANHSKTLPYPEIPYPPPWSWTALNYSFLYRNYDYAEGTVPPDDIPTFPPPRPDDYDPDLIWTPPTSPIPGNPNTWQDPGLPYQTTGGGRWGRNLVVAGNGKVYYEDYT